MLKRYILPILLSLIFLISLSKYIYADDNFFVDINITYKVNENGNTSVDNDITIENRKTEKYSLEYYFLLSNINPKNIEVSENGNNLAFSEDKSDNQTKLTIKFNDKIVGKDKKRNFNITYDVDNLAVRTGEVWEISIPKIANLLTFRNYNLSLIIPASFGEEAYLSPDPVKISKDDIVTSYYYDKDNISDSALVAGFGKFQVFSFVLNYHLENQNNKSSFMDIAIPPDTSYQRMYYENINPKPLNVTVDTDGNWIAKFKLKSKEKINVKVEGNVQVFANPRRFLIPEPVNLLNKIKATKYWNTEDLEIQQLAKELRTTENIYKFVVEKLKYNKDRVKTVFPRLGSKEILFQPQNATCMEFTDLFIALSRAAGIPAREINGYAYTENTDIQPLSLLNDVLHSWPEYWNDEMKAWVPVDPTWESTSEIDYFTKFDLRHFTFVIHGNDSENPVSPGFYKSNDNIQKDVFVNFGQLPEKKNNPPLITSTYKDSIFIDRNIEIYIENIGSTTIYDTNLDINFDNKDIDEEFIKILPPYSNIKLDKKVGMSFLAKDTPKKVVIFSGNQTYENTGPFNLDLIFQLLLFFMIITVFIIFLYFRIRKN